MPLSRKARRVGKKRRVYRGPVKARTSRGSTAPVVAAGTGAFTRAVFGVTAQGSPHQGFNALSPVHLALPRPVAPYTVLRFSRTISTHHRFVLFGPMVSLDEGTWLNTICITRGAGDAANAVGSGTYPWNNHGLTSTATLDVYGLTAVPSAFTVQAICTDPLQTASGLVQASVCTQGLDYADSTTTTGDLFTALAQVNQPRVMSAAKLSLRGVKADLYPLNMSLLSEFKSVVAKNATADWVSTAGAGNLDAKFAGFTPLFVENVSEANMSYIVTVEYRLRFSPLNVAAASHTYHKPSPIGVWDKAVKSAVSLGHGIRDIAEAVAETGQAIGRAYATGKLLARLPAAAEASLPALAMA